MTMLWVAALVFVALHIAVAGSPLRGVLVSALGESRYLALFSLLSAATLVWLAVAYSAAYEQGNVMLWSAGPWAKHLAAPVMLAALLLAAPGVLTPNPTAVRGERLLEEAPEPRGIQRITRHPFLVGVTIWSAFHLSVNGDQASVILFGAFLIVAVFGMYSIDRKRARALGERWRSYASVTSRMPFAAIARGQPWPKLREIGWWRLGAALVVFGILVSLHPMLFGAYPLPGMED